MEIGKIHYGLKLQLVTGNCISALYYVRTVHYYIANRQPDVFAPVR